MDSRTLLPDRDSFYHDAQALMTGMGSRDARLVLIVIETQGLDFVLRTFGPKERDATLKEVGRRIQEAAAGATVYHITQERFCLILPDCEYQRAVERAQEITSRLDETILVADVAYNMEGFAGISHYPYHADSITELVRTAVFACHQARKQQKKFASFDSELDLWEHQCFMLMHDLKSSLQEGSDIQLAYQPLLDLQSGETTAVEGLCRWKHKQKGLIPPGDFLPYVEQTALMMPLTETTLRTGLATLFSWQKLAFNGSIAINLSTTLFRHPDLLERLEVALHFHNVSPEKVHFEITETGIMDQPNRAVHVLSALRDKGCRISVDDFGTGHSSLAYLADLPVDTIKIDKHFIQSLDKPWGEAVVGATATLASKLNLVTVAEGIENEQQYRKCRELGIDLGQGFYLAHPMSDTEFSDWYLDNQPAWNKNPPD